MLTEPIQGAVPDVIEPGQLGGTRHLSAAQFVRVCGTRNTLRVDYLARTVTLEADALAPSALGRLLLGFQHSLNFLREAGRNAVRFAASDFHFFAGLGKLISLFYQGIESAIFFSLAAGLLALAFWWVRTRIN